MPYSSLIFILYFFPITVGVYYLLRFSQRLQNVWLLVASLFFYAWGRPIHAIFLLASIAVNYGMGVAIERRQKKEASAKSVLAIACALNLIPLFIYNYLSTLAKGAGSLFNLDTTAFSSILAPLGIVLITLHSISYLVDIYRQDVEMDKDPVNFALYITFFPLLIGGPILQYADVAHQIAQRKATWEDFSQGVCRFVTGLGKKVLIADAMALIADHVFSLSAMSGGLTRVPASLAWVGLIAFSLQIYHGLSGYSDMALGLGRIFGFHYRENFDYPYTALSVTDFWSRWYTSLLSWFNNYVLDPLTVRNSSHDRLVRNTFIMWLLIGLLFGCDWTFLIWGIWNGLFLTFERVIEFENMSISRMRRHIYVVAFILMGWTFFRVGDLYQLSVFVGNLLGRNGNGFLSDMALMFIREYWIVFLAGIVFSVPAAPKLETLLMGKQSALAKACAAFYPLLLAAMLLLVIIFLNRSGYDPFLNYSLL